MAKEPASLYNQCLLAYVKNLNHNVASLDRIAELRHLPTAILATVYEEVSASTLYFRDLHYDGINPRVFPHPRTSQRLQLPDSCPVFNTPHPHDHIPNKPGPEGKSCLEKKNLSSLVARRRRWDIENRTNLPLADEERPASNTRVNGGGKVFSRVVCCPVWTQNIRLA